MYSGQFPGAMYPYPAQQGSSLIPPFPMIPVMPIPMPPPGMQGISAAFPGFIKPEMGGSMQKIFLQSQKQQLLQLKDYVTKYADSIDEALTAIEEGISKTDKT